MPKCKYGDPFCPCQDGDQCHYEGENPMKETLHTPGPWYATGLSDCVRIRHAKDKGYTNVAKCGSSKPSPSEPSSDEVWANSRLIAAAPELLKLLEECEGHIAGELGEKITAAIRKTKGE